MLFLVYFYIISVIIGGFVYAIECVKKEFMLKKGTIYRFINYISKHIMNYRERNDKL